MSPSGAGKRNPEAVVLAGGMGTRLGDLTKSLPKPMLEVGDRPFLEHLVAQLAAQDFSRVLMLTGYRAEMIEIYFGDGSRHGIAIEYSREPEPLGTGGALRLASDRLAPSFLLLYADLYRQFDYRRFVTSAPGARLAVYRWVEGLVTAPHGNVDVDGESRRVTEYRKNDAAARLPFVDAGFGFFPREVVDLLPAGASSFEDHVYPALAARGELESVIVDRDFLDIGNPADLERARAALVS